MPLPPRDMGHMHLLLNPDLEGYHARHQLARYVPVMALFRLHKLHVEGLSLVEELDVPSWMTLACLDDQGADVVLTRAAMAMRMRLPTTEINRVVAATAAPYLVPMLVPGMTMMVPNPYPNPCHNPAPAIPCLNPVAKAVEGTLGSTPTRRASPATHVSDSPLTHALDHPMPRAVPPPPSATSRR